MWCKECKLYYLIKLRSYSYQLITKNKGFNVRANISQRMSGFCTQTIVLLKPSLLHVRLSGYAMAIS